MADTNLHPGNPQHVTVNGVFKLLNGSFDVELLAFNMQWSGTRTTTSESKKSKLAYKETQRGFDLSAGEEVRGSSSCISEEKKGFVFEADFAKDKGARHSMEDVSVVLPDASLDFLGY
ncbi:unnamed protein product [Brassica napus]|uniref:(rape) hypothetical protein n=1 Tax=Brassica napus TaxID=3708 RepID=A0A816SDV7_BRANA|nr:unnamed protein product [Brassica napus]